MTDSGLLHTLLGLANKEEIESHPKVGASWEGFAMNTVISQLKLQPEETFFWSTHSGAELDLVIFRGNKRLGFEFKRSSAPVLTRSLQVASDDLKLTHAYVVYAGNKTFPLSTNVTALGLENVLTDI